MKDLNFGIVGVGSIFPYYYHALEKKKLRLVGCSGSFKQKIINEVDFSYYTNPVDLIASDEVSIVIIATPPQSHYELVKLCLLNNKTVICEKPLTTNYEDYQELKNLAYATKTKLYAAYHARFQPVAIRSKELIQNLQKEYRITKVVISYKEDVRNYHQNSSWVFKKDISGGGCIIDSGINAISVVDNILGLLRPVSCILSNNADYPYIETQANISLINSEKIPVCLKMDWLNNHEERKFTFYFEKNQVIEFNFVDSSIVEKKLATGIEKEYVNLAFPNNKMRTSMYEEYENLLDDFINFYQTDKLINENADNPIETVNMIYKYPYQIKI